LIEVNLKGVWLCMKHEIPLMLPNGGGVIVNTNSIAGLIGLRPSTGYVAAKHGLIGLTKPAAVEYAETGVRVSAVCPGYIETRMTGPTRESHAATIIARTSMRRYGQLREIAEMVVWFCSDRASCVTGAAYKVDGASPPPGSFRGLPAQYESADPLSGCTFASRMRMTFTTCRSPVIAGRIC
jgi:NAD(P)-dependent dehydrogenase (short-subunit alcohol dehydrogenase family)